MEEREKTFVYQTGGGGVRGGENLVSRCSSKTEDTHQILTKNYWLLNLLKPNDIYICRTAALTSRRYILNIYSTNIHTEYFKHAA